MHFHFLPFFKKNILQVTFVYSYLVDNKNATDPILQLDYKVDEKKLREVFRLAGRVIHAELTVDKEGKSRGFGVVEYEHPVEAVQAICILWLLSHLFLMANSNMYTSVVLLLMS